MNNMNNISFYWNRVNDLDFLGSSIISMPEIIFDGIQTFGLVLKKIKTIFCVLFRKIEGSFEKY